MIENLSSEILSWLVGVFTAIGGVTTASKMKMVPFKIIWGENKNGKTIVTKDMLKENCEHYHGDTKKDITLILEGQKEHQKSIEDVRDRISFLEGKIL